MKSEKDGILKIHFFKKDAFVKMMQLYCSGHLDFQDLR